MKKFCKKCDKITRHYRHGDKYFTCAVCNKARARRNKGLMSDARICTHRYKIQVFEMYGNKCAVPTWFIADLMWGDKQGLKARRNRL